MKVALPPARRTSAGAPRGGRDAEDMSESPRTNRRRCTKLTLVATSQLAEGNDLVSLVGIEEPETAFHPAASGGLMDIPRGAATHTQVVVTTHSPEQLDTLEPEAYCLLPAEARRGNTVIGPIDPASPDATRTYLFTAGDVLRRDRRDVIRRALEREKPMPMFGNARTADKPARGRLDRRKG